MAAVLCWNGARGGGRPVAGGGRACACHRLSMKAAVSLAICVWRALSRLYSAAKPRLASPISATIEE